MPYWNHVALIGKTTRIEILSEIMKVFLDNRKTV